MVKLGWYKMVYCLGTFGYSITMPVTVFRLVIFPHLALSGLAIISVLSMVAGKTFGHGQSRKVNTRNSGSRQEG